jgi:hypothetical protein
MPNSTRRTQLMRTSLFVAAGALLFGAAVAAAAITEPTNAPPKPPAVRGIGLSRNVEGDTVTARWVYKNGTLPTTDTAIVVWRQKSGSATIWTSIGTVRTRLTSNVRNIPVPAPGTIDSIEVCVRVRRVGAQADSPSLCAKTGRSTISNPDPVDSLTVVSVLVKPDSASVQLLAAGATPTYKNQMQFCAAVRLSNNAVILTENSKPIGECFEHFELTPGFTTNLIGVGIRDAGLNIHIVAGDAIIGEEEVAAGGVPHQVIRATVEDAFYYEGEWWLNRHQAVPVS